LNVDSEQARADLLAMTPHGWRASAERREAVIAAPLKVTVSMRYDWFELDSHA
jgi:23S rRNA (guanine745-N1)-methyltransferase